MRYVDFFLSITNFVSWQIVLNSKADSSMLANTSAKPVAKKLERCFCMLKCKLYCGMRLPTNCN